MNKQTGIKLIAIHSLNMVNELIAKGFRLIRVDKNRTGRKTLVFLFDDTNNKVTDYIAMR